MKNHFRILMSKHVFTNQQTSGFARKKSKKSRKQVIFYPNLLHVNSCDCLYKLNSTCKHTCMPLEIKSGFYAPVRSVIIFPGKVLDG